MYLNDVSTKVKLLFEEINNISDAEKLEFMIYVFDCLYNNQINSKNETNPNLINDDTEIFNFETIGLENYMCGDFIEYLLSIHKDRDKVLFDNGAIYGLDYLTIKKYISMFERLEFEDKRKVIAELLIEYDNNTYFINNHEMKFRFNVSGYEIARDIIYIENI